MTTARSIRVRGVVQGVGFRPFIYRLARANSLAGWVLNAEEGVDIHLEGAEPALDTFLRELESRPPPAARIVAIDVQPSRPAGLKDFTIRDSRRNGHPSVRIAPDLPVCEECLRELFNPADPHYLYPYINCTNCGPRYTVIESLPYDRSRTTMKHWALDALCAAQYRDPLDRRFHAQPVACPTCGPHYHLESGESSIRDDAAAIEATVRRLDHGDIVAIKGIGGYHLACDARNVVAVRNLRERKFRKEKPFALMVRDIEIARSIAALSPEAEALLTSSARPIVLAPAQVILPEIAPDNDELGLMLPYAPLHYLLFAAGAPEVLVLTSANRSSEPIAYQDVDAGRKLSGIATAFLIGERPIARRVDDSVARAGAFGPMILRRSRGYAPGAVTNLPTREPVLAVGADLKNAITLVVDGQACVSQHIGDLEHYESLEAFKQTVQDLVSMYELDWGAITIVHDNHPQYESASFARELPSARTIGVQHHRAHVASVLAEKQAWDKRVIGVSFDGTGYGDDGTIWGGEFFVGSMSEGFERAIHLRKAALIGGDAAARHPGQCAAGFLAQLSDSPDFTDAPFHFPPRYQQSLRLLEHRARTFETTSIGRLFEATAALIGFTREISFEGQAAMWLEHMARSARVREFYAFPVVDRELDFRPLLDAVMRDRLHSRDVSEIARAFQGAVANALCDAVKLLSEAHSVDIVVLSGGVFQNEMLLEDVKSMLDGHSIQIWTNSAVPPNDGGISLGQAALGAFILMGEAHA